MSNIRSFLPADLHDFLHGKMYVVGAHVLWTRKHIGNKKFEGYLFFRPTADNVYRVSCLITNENQYTMISREAVDITIALETLGEAMQNVTELVQEMNKKQNEILSQTIYRLSKISFKDIKTLEPYRMVNV